MAKIFFLIIFIFSSCIYSQTFYIDHDIKQISITSDGQFHTVHYNGKLDLSSLDKVEGQPQLPVYLYKISLNENESIESFRIDKIKEQKLDGKYNIKIQQPLWRQDLEEKLPITGKTDQINFPQQLIEYTGTSSFNGYPIAHFAVHPFRYERDTGNLYFIEQIQFTINSGQVRSGSVKPNEKFRSGNEKLLSLAKSGQVNKISALSEAASGSSVDDSGIPLRYYSAGLVDRYIIITTEELAPAFASLAEWKTKKGVPTIIRTLDWIRSNFPDGLDDADCIRNYIRWSYKNRGTKYIMLGGDTELIPSRIITTGGFTFPADYYFADLDGNWNADQDDTFGEAVDHLDGYPEVYVSRIPVQTQVQVSRFVSRLFQYEKLINIDNPDFPANVLYMAANLNKENDSRDLIMNYIDPQINGDFQRTLLTQSEDIGNDPAPALNALNNSPAIIFTENHGLYHTIRTGGRGSNIYAYQVGRLTNHDPGIWYVASCYTNDIVKRSFSEMYLLAENGGGVAYIGNSSYEYPFSGIQLKKEFFLISFSEVIYNFSVAHYLYRLPFLG
ncbi:MAG: C25 family cysteine peptidase, partial [Calditrichaceae bacterium]